jgi:hypothetical protein
VTSGEFAGARAGPQQLRELARGFRDPPIPSQMQMGGGDSRDELHVLDEVAPHSRMLAYAGVCWRMLAYADVFWRMLTYADVCWRMLTYADVC